MANRVRELYDGPGEEGKCPGPEVCHIYNGAAQDSPDPEENERNLEAACGSAGKFCARLYSVDEDAQIAVSLVEEIVQARDSGKGPVDLTEMLWFEWYLLQVWDALAAEYERKYQKRVVELAETTEQILKDLRS